jgi:hypothetical protein
MNKKRKKVMKVGGVKMKKNEKNCVLQFEKGIFFTALFWLAPWLCIPKMTCRLEKALP